MAWTTYRPLDSDSRVRRALLRKSTPTRGAYPVGSYVYFYRAQVQPGTSRTYRWHGPARVIGVEVRNQRRQQDPEPPTDGGQPHTYWLRYGATVVLVTGEQLRFASEDELLAAHMVPQEALEPPYARGARNYVDMRPAPGTTPPPLEQEEERPPPNSLSTPSVTVPGTNISVLPQVLPPILEGTNEGGSLDNIGAGGDNAVPRDPQQDQRTGGPEMEQQVPMNEGNDAVHRDPEQDQRTGGPGTIIDQNMSRRTSEAITEPEPYPTPSLRPAEAPQAQLPPQPAVPDQSTAAYRPVRQPLLRQQRVHDQAGPYAAEEANYLDELSWSYVGRRRST